jgi:acyl-CoA synthetase (AMP-forming)/AMP-acid ligase II
VHESYATVWEAAGDVAPDAVAVQQGKREVTWREFDERAARFAGALAAAGFGRNTHVALYTTNCPEYLEAHFGSMKLRAVPAPVNFRYRAAELAHLLENADAEVLVYHRGLGERVAEALDHLPLLRLLVDIEDGSGAPRLDGAIEYEAFIGGQEPLPRVERSGDDFMLWYTGGTTGLPKGVVWHQEALLNAGLNMESDVAGVAVPADLDELRTVVAGLHASGRAPVALAATPLVHATAIYQANSALLLGGRVVMLERHPLDGDEVCEVIDRERVTIFAVIGDVVASRIVRALERAEAEGRPYDISSLRRIHNSGAMASGPVKDALLSRGTMTFYDALGSSEGTGYGAWLATAPGEGTTAKFRPGPHTKVLRADGTEAPNGEAGMLATAGPIAIAYYKDPERSAVVFRTIDGRPYSVNGDWGRLEVDGTITLLGRGSGCINTGGEKVWPEEVEETLKQHPRVVDAAVVGVPDENWGEAVGAVVAITDGPELATTEIGDWVADRLAGYKRPRRIAVVDEVLRTTVSKVDLEWAREVLVRSS